MAEIELCTGGVRMVGLRTGGAGGSVSEAWLLIAGSPPTIGLQSNTEECVSAAVTAGDFPREDLPDPNRDWYLVVVVSFAMSNFFLD